MRFRLQFQVWSNKSPEDLARAASLSLFLTDDGDSDDDENDLVDYNKIILKIPHGVRISKASFPRAK